MLYGTDRRCPLRSGGCVARCGHGAGWKRVWPARPCHCPSRVASGASPVGPCDPALTGGGHAMPCHSSPPAQKRDEGPVCCGVKTTPIPESAGPDSATTAEDVGGKVQPKSPPCLVVLQCRQMVPHPWWSRPGSSRQVVEQQVQLTQRLGRQRLADAVGEFLKVQPASRVVVCKLGRGLVAVGVGGAKLLVPTSA